MLKEEYILRMKSIIPDFESYLKTYNNPITRAIRINKEANFEYFINNNDLLLEKMPYGNNSYYLKNEVKLGFNPYHHAGVIYSQEPSAMIVANAYNFKEDDIVLDLCASPGGKTGQISELLNNGLLISNEIDRKRSQILYSNIERMGYKNVIVTNNDSNELKNKFKGFFDCIVIDAPCSGEGMMRKDNKAIQEWSLYNLELCAKRDKEILDNADIMLKTNGIIIYSTCTFEIIENEDMVNYLINKGYHLIDVNESIKGSTVEGINMPLARRFYPHKGIGEGQFVAVLQKDNIIDSFAIKKLKYDNNKIVNDFIIKYTNLDTNNIIINNTRVYYNKYNYDLRGLNVVSNGIYLGEIMKNRFEPSHQFFKAFGHEFKYKIELKIDDLRLNKYLRGEEIEDDGINGYGVVLLANMPIGGVKGVNGTLKNYYPKGLRNF